MGRWDASTGRKDPTEQEIGLIEETSSSPSFSDLSSGSAESERVRVERPVIENRRVEVPATSSNEEDVDEVNPPNND